MKIEDIRVWSGSMINSALQAKGKNKHRKGKDDGDEKKDHEGEEGQRRKF